MAQTFVTPTASGAVTLSAVGSAGAVTITFTSVAPPEVLQPVTAPTGVVVVRGPSLTSVRPVQFVAENAALTWTPQVILTDDSAPTTHIPVTWTGSFNLSFTSATTFANADGLALGNASAPPLAAGEVAHGTACAWTNICSPITLQAVSSGEWRIVVVSGSAQSVGSGDTLGSVVLRIVNLHGDPIAAAPVEIEQTVSSWEAACPAAGRCPVAAVLASSRLSLTSDIDGLLTVTPAQLANTPSLTQLAAIAGAQGFASISLEKHP